MIFINKNKEYILNSLNTKTTIVNIINNFIDRGNITDSNVTLININNYNNDYS